MDVDNAHQMVLKYAFDRGTRGEVLRNPDTRAAIDRLLALGATSPENARALQDLTPQEKSAFTSLRLKGLVCEIAPDFWCLHPRTWDQRYDITARQQAWIAVVVGAVAVVALWLKYFS